MAKSHPLRTIRPRAVHPGATVGIVAPAGPIADLVAFDAGVAALERMGYRARYDERVFESRGYLAGEDGARAAELGRYLADPEVEAIIALRGGYGSARLVAHLDSLPLAEPCKVFMGFSDLTTLLLYFRRRFGWVTIHGPMLTSPALHAPTPEAERHLTALWSDPGYRPRLHFPELEVWRAGTAEGPLVGGCLSLVAASLGTPYEIDTTGAILFLEELGEAPYRVDRMLTQLRLSGKLDVARGFLLGTFENCEAAPADPTVEDTLRELLEPFGPPIIANFPAGHGSANWALPLHTRVRLDGVARGLEILDPAVE